MYPRPFRPVIVFGVRYGVRCCFDACSSRFDMYMHMLFVRIEAKAYSAGLQLAGRLVDCPSAG